MATHERDSIETEDVNYLILRRAKFLSLTPGMPGCGGEEAGALVVDPPTARTLVISQMAIQLLDVYRSPNIGVFLRTNERFLLAPRGLVPTKSARLAGYLGVTALHVSIGGSRLIGPLVAMNSNGIVVSRLAGEDEIKQLSAETGLPVERAPSRYTSIGNLVSANDRGAVASTLLANQSLNKIADVLDVPIEPMNLGPYLQVGALLVATNTGAVVHPQATDEEIVLIKGVLRVTVEPATINGGVPFVASGIVANSRSAVVGTATTGPELMILSRAFGF